MLAITGGINLWYVSNVTNMRYGKYRLFAEEPLSDMEREAFLETIQDLKESVKNANDMIRSLQSELDRSNRLTEQYLSLITDLRSMIADLQKKLEEREKEISDLRDLNNRHNKMNFGNKSTSRKFKL